MLTVPLIGGSHIETNLYNIEHIRQLVAEHEAKLNQSSSGETSAPSNGRQKATINTEYEARLVSCVCVCSTVVYQNTL